MRLTQAVLDTSDGHVEKIAGMEIGMESSTVGNDSLELVDLDAARFRAVLSGEEFILPDCAKLAKRLQAGERVHINNTGLMRN